MKGTVTVQKETILQNFPIQFEEGYIFKNSRSITSTPDIAITEFVANAWDAGAYHVKIIVPEECGRIISVEDDGIGISSDDFTPKWMMLGYDRQKRQGREVIFPTNVEKYHRMAYGRNGVGRHGMFCFADNYTVETWQNGTCNRYDIALAAGSVPYKIINQNRFNKPGHGTKISTYVERRLPDIESMTDIISARFLYDPKFMVSINGKSIDLLSHKGIYEKKEILLENGVKLNLTVIDSTKTAMKSQQHGVAFWVSGRLVGKPSWTYGDFQFLDGRYKIAKRYTLIIQTDDLMDYVLPDWTGFVDTLNMSMVYSQLKGHVDEFVYSVMADQVDELQSEIIKETRDGLETLTPLGKRDVSTFIKEITYKAPTIQPDFLKIAVEAVIKIEQAKKGQQLLNQLCQMSTGDIDRLSDLLKEWDIDDILSVITEIDKRISVVEAIERVFSDMKTDELHTLHPLILGARWLFGAEFDSPMFTSNVALATVVRQLFKADEIDLAQITNPRKRPDIVCLKTSTFRAVCTNRSDKVAGGIMKPDQVLVLELKRGGSIIESEEISQAENYVRQIRKSGILHEDAAITAFVVGAKIGDIDCTRKTDSGHIHAVTYGQLVETANTKLFSLREQLTEHYAEIGDESIVERALKEPKQLELKGDRV